MYSKNPLVKLDLHDCQGRIFAIGDIHGQYDALMRLLERQGFSEADQLILVGDLVDRGRGSFDAINFVFETSNVHSVMGNHEEMMANAYFPLLQKVKRLEDLRIMEDASSHLEEYLVNYGHWMYSMSQEDWGDFHAIMASLGQLPYVLDVILPGGYRVGVCHADYPERRFGAITDSQIKANPRLAMHMTWGRSLGARVQRWASLYRIGGEDVATLPASFFERHGEYHLAGVDLMLHGHTVMPAPILAGSHLFLDTGGCFLGGRLSMVELSQEGPRLLDSEAR